MTLAEALARTRCVVEWKDANGYWWQTDGMGLARLWQHRHLSEWGPWSEDTASAVDLERPAYLVPIGEATANPERRSRS